MSDTGLHAALYGEIRELAELVDVVIAEFLAGSLRPGMNDREDLAGRLKEMTDAPSSGLLLRYLGPSGGAVKQSWAELASALQQEPVPEWVPDRLERLARLLECGRSAALERLHGVDAR